MNTNIYNNNILQSINVQLFYRYPGIASEMFKIPNLVDTCFKSDHTRLPIHPPLNHNNITIIIDVDERKFLNFRVYYIYLYI